MFWTSKTLGGVPVKINFSLLVERGTMMKITEFPMEPEVHFNYDERYSIAFRLHDTMEEAFPMIQSIAQMELYKVLYKYKEL